VVKAAKALYSNSSGQSPRSETLHIIRTIWSVTDTMFSKISHWIRQDIHAFSQIIPITNSNMTRKGHLSISHQLQNWDIYGARRNHQGENPEAQGHG
jgi:hypothetical protein